MYYVECVEGLGFCKHKEPVEKRVRFGSCVEEFSVLAFWSFRVFECVSRAFFA